MLSVVATAAGNAPGAHLGRGKPGLRVTPEAALTPGAQSEPGLSSCGTQAQQSPAAQEGTHSHLNLETRSPGLPRPRCAPGAFPAAVATTESTTGKQKRHTRSMFVTGVQTCALPICRLLAGVGQAFPVVLSEVVTAAGNAPGARPGRGKPGLRGSRFRRSRTHA